MRLALERGVPLEERHKAALGSFADWDTARIFLEVVRRGSFRSAAAANEIFENLFPGYSQRDLLVMKTNVSSAHYWAVANGAGIGAFPTYACALGGRMIPLEIKLQKPYDIWLSYHPGSGRIPRVRHMIDWLIEAFNPAKNPLVGQFRPSQ